jgi:copper chaperone
MNVTETVKIEGMSCEHCVAAVKKAVGGLDGVKSVEVSLEKGQAVVGFDNAVVGHSAIKDAIEDQGYDVTGFSD